MKDERFIEENHMKTFSKLALAMFFLSLCVNANAAVPGVMNFSGHLKAGSGADVEGSAEVTITFWNHPTEANEANNLFSETQEILVQSGRFNMMFGANPENAIPPNVVEGNEVYIGVKVNADPEMTPRARVGSVPFALKAGEAETLSGHDAADFAAVDHTHAFSGLTGQLGEAQLPSVAVKVPGTCNEGQVLKKSGSTFVCSDDNDTTYSTAAGGGLVFQPSGSTAFSLLRTCSENQILKWSGTAWECATDAITDGTGIEADTLDSQHGTFYRDASNINNGVLAVERGGTSASNAASARTGLEAAKSGANSDITSLSGLTTPLSIVQGGTGINAAGTAGNVLRSNGSIWVSSVIQALDLPQGSPNYIQNQEVSTQNANFNISGNGAMSNLSVSNKATISNNVGIGTTSPAANLHVAGNLSTPLTGTVTIPGGTNTLYGSGTLFQTELNPGDAIKVAGEVLTVAGIDTNTQLTLSANHVAGALNALPYRDSNFLSIQNGAGQGKLVVDKSGNVGIGMTNPGQKLSVEGTIESTSGGVKFPDGTTQSSSCARHYATISTSSYSTNFVIAAAAFTPPLPSSITTVPVIEVFISQYSSSAQGGAASVAGFDNAAGTPFHGTSPGKGVYFNTQIGDRINLTQSYNGVGSGNATWLIVAIY